MVGPTFTCFLKRAAAVLFSIDFSAPHLPPVLEGKSAKSPVCKLETISIGLCKMYHGTKDESQRKSLLDLVAQNKAFIYFVIQLACKAIQLCGKCKMIIAMHVFWVPMRQQPGFYQGKFSTTILPYPILY